MNTTKSSRLIIGILCLLLGASLAHSGCERAPATSGGAAKATVYQQVIERGSIRCGYVPYPPGCIKDPGSGELSGVFVDALEAAAANLDLQVEWTEEVGWGTMIEGLRTGRYDIVGSPVWANASRAKFADFTVPLFFSGLGVYVRADDSRFTSDLTALNDADVKLSTLDGEMSAMIAETMFPKAQTLSLPQLADTSQLLLNVSQGRADATFVEPYIAELFLRSRPGVLVNVASSKPIRVFPNTMMVRKGEAEFLSMLNVALQEIMNTGAIEALLGDYEVPPGSFYMPDHPYRVDTITP